MYRCLYLTVVLLSILTTQAFASTGDLQGNCKKVAEERFPESELIGMTGGSVMNYNVTGYLINKNGTPYQFYCIFRYSHGQPYHFSVSVYGEGEKNPVAYTREAFKQQEEYVERQMERRQQMEERRRQKEREAMRERQAEK